MKKEMKSRNYANSMELTPVKDRNSNTNENMTKIHFIKSLDRHEKKEMV